MREAIALQPQEPTGHVLLGDLLGASDAATAEASYRRALELDAGVTYLDSEPLGRVQSRPLYRETYCLVSRDAETGPVDWTEAAGRPLCLLTPDMQNRRIVTRHLLEAGADAMPRVESTSMLAILSHVATGDWAAILPQSLARGSPLPHGVGARRLAGAGHMVGLVTARREPHPPLVEALLKATDSIDVFNQ